MKRLFLLIATGGLVSMLPMAAQPSGIIGGVVRNGWSKAPLKRAIVTLRTSGTDIMEALTYSESSGAFAFTGVPAGEYTLCARLSGYERACFGGGGDDQGRPAALLTLAPAQKKQDVLLAMLPNGSVSGTVMDPDGDAVPRARVELLRPVYSRRSLHWQAAGQTMTNEKGEYHLPFAQPGEYRVMATGRYQQASLIRPEAVAGQAVQEEVYTPQYFPGAASVEAAESLTLNAGNDLKGIDFTLATTPQLSISGVVHPPEGKEIESVNIRFHSESQTGPGSWMSFGANPPDYIFQANVPAGRYHVFAESEEKDHTYRADQWVEAGASTNNISLTLTPGTPLTGKLIVEGESLGAHGPYTINLTAGDDGDANGTNPTAEVSENGTFEFSGVFPGVWDIGVTPMPPGSFMKSARLGDLDVLTKDMKLDGETQKPLTLVLSTKGAVVSGNVMAKDQSAPVTTIRSRLLLAPAGKNEDVLGFYKTTVTDGKGHFELKGIPPGTYRLYAFDRLRLDEYWKPDFLKPFTAAAGDAFVLGEGVRVTQDTTLIVRDLGVIE